MNRGQKLIGNLSAQELIILLTSAFLFVLVLLWILGTRLEGPQRVFWLDESFPDQVGRGAPIITPEAQYQSQPIGIISRIEANCTYPSNYWRAHPEVWIIENLVFGNRQYSRLEILDILSIDSPQNGAVMNATANPNPATELQKQYIVAALNTMKGADDEAVAPILVRAGNWLEKYQPGSRIPKGELRDVLIMAEALKGYNTGWIGPGPCEFQEVVTLPTPIPVALPAAPDVSTPTSAQKQQLEPTSTPWLEELKPTRMSRPQLAATSTPTALRRATATLPQPATWTPAANLIPTAAPPTATSSPTPGVMPTTTAIQTEAASPTSVPSPGSNSPPTRVPTSTIPVPTPTEAPTPAPTLIPTEAPTQVPTQAPTEVPTQAPTEALTQAPTEAPTQVPTTSTEASIPTPTPEPTNAPEPTDVPVQAPTDAPPPPAEPPPSDTPPPNPTEVLPPPVEEETPVLEGTRSPP